jgi:hypothetical protein
MNDQSESTTDSKSLANRLHGIYVMPVDDGAGLLNGSNEFTRQFDDLPPINEEAAKRIERLEAALEAIIKHQDVIGGGLAKHSTTKLIAERALNG